MVKTSRRIDSRKILKLLKSGQEKDKLKALKILSEIDAKKFSRISGKLIYELIGLLGEETSTNIFCWVAMIFGNASKYIPEKYIPIIAYFLIKKLDSPDPYIKTTAVWALGEIRERSSSTIILSSLGKMINLLHDENTFVRNFATDTIIKIFDHLPPYATEILLHSILKNLDSESQTLKLSTLYLLWKIVVNHPNIGNIVIPRLAKTMNDPSTEIRKLSAWILAEILK